MKIANFTGKLLPNYKQLKCEIFRIHLKHVSDHISADQCFFKSHDCIFKISYDYVSYGINKTVLSGKNSGEISHRLLSYGKYRSLKTRIIYFRKMQQELDKRIGQPLCFLKKLSTASHLKKLIQNPVEHLRWSFLRKQLTV